MPGSGESVPAAAAVTATPPREIETAIANRRRRRTSPTGRPGTAWPAWFVVPLYLAAYLALDWLSFIHALHGVGITPWNPSPGLSLALLLTQGLRYAPALVLAAFLSSMLLPT